VLPETDIDGAVVVAEKIRELVESVRVMAEDGRSVSVTVSIGLGTVGGSDDPERPSALGLVAVADRNLFIAKGLGRNRIEPARMEVPA